MTGLLRVIDAGLVPPLRSQSLWHGIGSAMADDAAPTLSLCRPSHPYVCIGFHRRLSELDLAACSELGLPVLRRQIGGGPVYCDSDQLFFQLTMPAATAPASVDRLYAELLEPAASALRALGIEARLECVNEIVVEDRKLSGTGAGRIGKAVTVVGNVIFRFPHGAMARVLDLPDEEVRAEFLRLLRRYVSSFADEGMTEVPVELVGDALVDAFAASLRLEPVAQEPTPHELRAIESWESRLLDDRWLRGPAPRPAPTRTVKVRAGVWLVLGEGVAATVIDGRLEHVIGASARAAESLLEGVAWN